MDTRDKNSSANYCLEQKGLGQIRDHLLFINGPGGHAYKPAFPELYINGTMPPDNLSCNSVDIESRLFGINTNNLVNPAPPTQAQLKTLPTTTFFEKPKFQRSERVQQDTTQRPFIVR